MNTSQPYGEPHQQPPFEHSAYGQSPYAQYPVPPPLPGSSGRWGPSSLGIDPTIAAGLGYLFPIVAVVWLIAERTNRFVRFHAAQAVLLLIGYLALALAATPFVLIGALTLASASAAGASGVPAGLGVLFGLAIAVMVVIGVVYTAFHLWGIIAGFTGRYTRFPLLGAVAERWAGGPAVPLY